MDILNNAWILGIGGGILSGLIVTPITRYLFLKKDSKEYAQKVLTVNQEIVFALRPGISEGHIPNNEVLSSLINATARKYKVSRRDVYQSKQIAEELIKEIMDSSFISSETKKNYCETMAHLVSANNFPEEKSTSGSEYISIESEYRRKQTDRMSVMLGTTAAIGTVIVGLASLLETPFISSPIMKLLSLTLPSIVVLGSVVITTMAMIIRVKFKKIVNERHSKEDSLS